MHRRALAIEESKPNVADGALLCEILQLFIRESIAGIGEHDGRLERAYPDEGDCEAAKLIHCGADVHVTEHHEACR